MENYKDANINIMGIVSNSSRGDVLKALTEHFTAEETSLTKKTFFFFFFTDKRYRRFINQNPYINKENMYM